jgi:hypothetical protein
VVGKLLEQRARLRVQRSEVLLGNSRTAVYLVDHELRVEEYANPLDSATAGELEAFDKTPVLRNSVDGGPDWLGDLINLVTVGVLEDDPDRTFSWMVEGAGTGTVCLQ